MGGGTHHGFYGALAGKSVGPDREARANDGPARVFTGWANGLTFEESLCWVFNTPPSRLDELYWSHTLEDLRKMVELRIQYDLMRFIQEKESFRDVVAEAMGTKTETKSRPPPETYEELAGILSAAGAVVH